MPTGVSTNTPMHDRVGGHRMFETFATCCRFVIGNRRAIAFRPSLLRLAGVVNSIFVFILIFPMHANGQIVAAQSVPIEEAASNGLLETLADSTLGSGEVILLALFGGAMSFAMMAAFWLIRERNRVADENRHLRQSLSNYKVSNERIEALVHVADQRVVLWNGNDDTPVVLGSLSEAGGAPASKTEFVDFGSWLTGDSCKTFEEALVGLRKRADAFDMALQTSGGSVIEAQGRTSGAYAFVRFIELSGERAALAQLETDHTRLLATFDSIQALFDRLDMQVWLSKRDGSLYWANNAYAKAVEASDAISAIENDLRLFDRAERQEIQAVIGKQKYFTGSLPAIISGDRKIVDVVEVASGRGSAGIAVDKSDVEEIRNTLKLTVTNHANTLNQLATAIAIFDADKNLQFYNSSFQQLWKLDAGFLESRPSNAEILGAMRDKKRLPPQPDWRKWRDNQLDIYQAMEPREEWWHLPDGVTLRVVVNPQSLGGATWIFEDVTEELELKSSYNSLIRVQGETLDHLSEAVAVFGADGRLRLSNPALWKMLNLENLEIESEIHIAELSKHLVGKFETSEIWDEIVGVVTGYDDERGTRKGRLFLLDAKIIEYALVPLPDGRTMLTLVDATANVKFETALKERNLALEEAGNLKNRFLQHVSYELRTPLTTISGFAELLSMEQTGKLNGVQAEYLDHINASSSVLKAIIDDILDLATIDAGAMELELLEFDIESAISSVVENLSAMLEKNNVSIKTKFTARASRLVADSTRFRQIIYNLISNAINHTPDGSNITVTSKLKDGNILVSVSDEGPGVAIDVRERIFSRFESGAGDDMRNGAGLGLSIVKSFMKLHKGDVHIEDGKDRGAKFVCSFPVKSAEILEAAQ